MAISKQSLIKLLENRVIQLSLFGGLIFMFFFYWAYSNIDSDFYQVRDDGVITMSHAKNWVDYGFIGVSPSGDRVEGYSAPVQFFIYASAYALTGISYETYANVQTAIFTFLLGTLVALFFKENRAYALAISVFIALILSNHTAFLQWHGSGMENPITHFLFLATLLILYSFTKEGKIVYPWAIIVFLATISRIDSVYHIAPLLIIFSGFWLCTFKNLRGLYFSFIVFILWLSYHLCRYIYFGDLLPNTAYAQDIIISERLHLWVSWIQWNIDRSIVYSKQIFSHHGGYLLLLVTPFLFFIRREKAVLLLFLLIASLVITSYFNPFFFGPTRIDPVRTTTQLALFTALAMTSIFYFVEDKKHILWIAPVSILGGLFAFKLNAIEPYYMCCRVQEFVSVHRTFTETAEAESLPRPTVSNPDLGVMSWYKQFNIVDFGMLGSPIIAKLKNGPIFSEYFFDYAAPDMFESHDYWTCRFQESIFDDPRFRQLYKPVIENLTEGYASCDDGELLKGIWIRKDILSGANTPERILIDDLKMDLSVDRLRHELVNCQKVPEINCIYIARTAFRFLPEFRDNGQISTLNKIFSASRTKDYDSYLINGYTDGQSHVNAIQHISSQYINKVIGSRRLNKPIIRSNYDVYLHNNNLVYVKNLCSAEDIEARFFLHVIPKNDSDLLPSSEHGFNDIDFNFQGRGHVVELEEKCIAIRELPNYNIRYIRTGQYIPYIGKTWEDIYHFE